MFDRVGWGVSGEGGKMSVVGECASIYLLVQRASYYIHVGFEKKLPHNYFNLSKTEGSINLINVAFIKLISPQERESFTIFNNKFHTQDINN